MTPHSHAEDILSALTFYATRWTDKRLSVGAKDLRWREPTSALREDGGQIARRALDRIKAQGCA